ncbi:MAG: BON domain-containing protein [Terracidiphilus sp.]|jgi:hypothetical protein
MNRPIFKRVFPQALAWVGLVALYSVLALAQGTAAPASPSDAVRTDGQIEMDVVHALDASPELKNDLITAATIQGEVTLSGTVSSASSRDLAESIARHVAGVTKVNNNLKVGNQQTSPTAPETADSSQGEAEATNPAATSDADAQIRAAIRAEVQAQIQTQRQARRQDPNAPPPPPAVETPKGPVTIPQGTLLRLLTSEPVSSKHAKDGQPVQFVMIRDVTIDGVVAIPRGATVHGVVTDVRQSGDLKGSPELALKLTSLDLGGQNYPLDTGQFRVRGPGKGPHSADNMVGSTVLGTLVGCAVRGPLGCAVGAGAGLAAGTVASAATPGPNVWIPSEAMVEFHLNAPLTVTPVSAQEAARLAQGLVSGGPNLYRRDYDPNGYRPVIYYHPYIFADGYYYWR